LARESLAASWDVPSGRVLSNAGLIALAKRRPSDAKDVARVGGLQGRAMHYANTFLAAIRRGENDGDVPEADRPAFAREVVASAEIHARREREKRLGAWRQRESAERGVDLQVVIPGHVLADLVRFRPRDVDELARIPGIGRVRVDRYGAALLAVLDESDAAGRGTDESA
jgi:ribonuclease D